MASAAVSAQIPAGWNYNPFLYYPYTGQPAPVQETAEVAAARAAHLAAHTSAGGSRIVAVQLTCSSLGTTSNRCHFGHSRSLGR